MNQSLNALMTKLHWQLNEFNLHLQQTQNTLCDLALQMKEIETRLNHADAQSLIINPELEINRLNFVTQQHEKKENLAGEYKNHQDTEHKLLEKIQRLKTELKMLEKYLAREALTQQAQQKKQHDNAMDEWVIQKRES